MPLQLPNQLLNESSNFRGGSGSIQLRANPSPGEYIDVTTPRTSKRYMFDVPGAVAGAGVDYIVEIGATAEDTARALAAVIELRQGAGTQGKLGSQPALVVGPDTGALAIVELRANTPFALTLTKSGSSILATAHADFIQGAVAIRCYRRIISADDIIAGSVFILCDLHKISFASASIPAQPSGGDPLLDTEGGASAGLPLAQVGTRDGVPKLEWFPASSTKPAYIRVYTSGAIGLVAGDAIDVLAVGDLRD